MGGDGKRTKFPWLGVARYAVAVLLAVAVVATIGMAIAAVLRPAKLELSVVNGVVSMDRPQSRTPPQLVNYKVTLRAFNPSGRAMIHFRSDNVVKLYFTAPHVIEFLSFSVPTFKLPQKTKLHMIKAGSFEANNLPEEIADRLYNGESEQVLVQAKASLSFTVGRVGRKGSDENFTFSCWPVSVASSSEVFDGADASCSQSATPGTVTRQNQTLCLGSPCPSPPPPPPPNLPCNGSDRKG
ncbi:hypothetical protein ABZP36_017043 [Zizania latifolia]